MRSSENLRNVELSCERKLGVPAGSGLRESSAAEMQGITLHALKSCTRS